MSGFLTRSIAWFRKFTDEPSTSAKYSSAEIIDLLGNSYSLILGELSRIRPEFVLVYVDVTLSGVDSADVVFALPPIIQSIERVDLLDSNSETVSRNLYNRATTDSWGPGFRIEPGALWVQKGEYSPTDKFRIFFVPDGTACLHEGTAGTVTPTTVVLAATPSIGNLDTHPNAYAGSILRILTASTNNYIQERVISSYDATTRVATLKTALSPVPSGATITYEICPILSPTIDMVIPAHAALSVLSIEGDSNRTKRVRDIYNEWMRSLRLKVSGMDNSQGFLLKN